MGGQVQQSSCPSHHDHHGGTFSDSHTGESTDAAMSRWLQSAGLQHLASPAPSNSINPCDLINLRPQDYASHGNVEDRKKLFRLIRSISGGIDPASESFTPPANGSGGRDDVNGPLSSPELRGEIEGGILDLHLIDDSELLSEDATHEPFEVSPFVTVTERGYENEPEVFWSTNKAENKLGSQSGSNPMKVPGFEKEIPSPDILASVARIKVVVRKRPLNKKELARKEDDIITIDNSGFSLSVHEPKLKVDLTAYVEKHDFVFDAVLDDQVSNDEVYRVTVQPIIPAIFQRTKATCFAYGQTGSGKTFTMQPIPLRACQDILDLMQHSTYTNQGLQLWLSFFEIYGGKLYDLLTERRKLCMREDGRQQVCIVGLKEFPVSNVECVKEYIDKGNASRSTGSTGANEESSRSHAILQLVIKKHSNKKDERTGKLVGKFSFIDLAGSERGADTTDNDRQTRIEGAEINKSLLALKECIRALDHDQGHIPFRGSKLTEVLRDSFVGDSRTVMISCISPNAGSCEHTLNTLRYADRVKGLSKSSNSKRDPNPYMGIQIQKDTTCMFSNSSAELLSSNDFKFAEPTKKTLEQPSSQSEVVIPDNWTYEGLSNRHDYRSISSGNDSDRFIVKESTLNFNYKRGEPVDTNEQDKNYSYRSKIVKDDKADKYVSALSNDDALCLNTLRRTMSHKEEPINGCQLTSSKDLDMTSQTGYNVHISAILEEEENLIAVHRLAVEDTMDLVREEMKLLTDIDQPGSQIDHYVSQLSYLLSKKASGIVNLQAQLTRFQRHLKEHGILSQNVN